MWVNGTRYELQEIYGIANLVYGADCDGNDLDKECVTVYQNHGTPTVLPCRDKDLRQGLEDMRWGYDDSYEDLQCISRLDSCTGSGRADEDEEMAPKVEESEGKKDNKNRNNKKKKEVLDEEVKVSGCSSRRGYW
ncbi:hypothetical protein Tco_0518167 [Tanacetum coccineum]